MDAPITSGIRPAGLHVSSGKVHVRMPADAHSALVEAAADLDVSLNSLVVDLLIASLGIEFDQD